jgi:hypothetical protein
MKSKKGPFNPNSLLWWVAIIALVVTGFLYYLLGEQAEVDVSVRQTRMIVPVIGIIIAGVCLIVGTAGRWFYPK